MYKILIVDDEIWARVSIKSRIQMQNLAFTWIKEASNGKEALEIIKNENPDIVFVDVKMPYMDGIQLIEKTRELSLDTRFVIISGYAEFEYAEQAINKGASGYLLKPVSNENISQVFQKLIKSMNYEKELNEVKLQNNSLEMKNSKMMVESIINQALYAPSDSGDDITDSKYDILKIDKSSRFALMLINIDNSNFQDSGSKYQNMDNAKSAIIALLEKMDKNENILILNNHKDSKQLMVLPYHPDETHLKAVSETYCVDAYAKIKKQLGMNVTIGCSDIRDTLSGELFKRAKEALDLRLAYGNNRIYKYEGIEIKRKFDLPEHKLKLLQNCIRLYDFKNTEAILTDIFTNMDTSQKASSSFIKYLFSEVNNILLKICSQLDIDMGSLQDGDLVSGEILNHFDCLEEIVSYLYTTIIDILKPKLLESYQCKELVEKTRNYIRQNYREEIVIRDIARKFAINPSYLSTIFKQETGKTITNYITEVRIEKACHLLTCTDASITEIAGCVGYQDPQYFYRVFKKVTGMTTLEFRNRK